MNAAWTNRRTRPRRKSSRLLDSTKPAGSVKIRIETIVHYLAKYSDNIIQKKLALLPPECPLLQEKEKSMAAVTSD
jgi:hypothetical protein